MPRRGSVIRKAGQTIVDVTNGKLLRLLVDDEPFDVRYGELLEHERVLDMRAGTLTRTTHWRSPAGKQVRVVSTRLVSLVATQRRRDRIHGGGRSMSSSASPFSPSWSPTKTSPRRPRDPQGVGRTQQSVGSRSPRKHRQRSTSASTARGSSELMMAAAMDHDVEVPGRVEVHHRSQGGLGSHHRHLWSAARSDGCASSSTWPTAGRACAPARRCGIKRPQRSAARATPDGTACCSPSASTSTSSGTAPMWRSRATPTASRRCGSDCSTCCRPAHAPNAGRSRARG